MNTNRPSWTVCAILAMNLMVVAVRSAGSAGQTNSAPQRIGTYDSRAIAVAFAGSGAHQEMMKPIKADHDRAKAAGDTNRMNQIEADMRARQKLAHKQAFSTAPVDELLKSIEGSMMQLKQKAHVSVIISKWDDETLKKYPSAEKIDVTMLLVDEFHPNERQRKSAVEIQKHKPISSKDAENIKD